MLNLKIKNFQSHADTELDFGEGVNAIVGVSDSGKSAIMRAIRWLWTSRPLGDSMLRWGQKECKVVLGINGRVVERGKQKNKNWYLVDGKELSAIKSDVPAEVEEALALKDINFQSQRDLDFLLSLTPSDASRYIQNLCGLQAVPPILSTVASMELQSKRKSQELEQEIEQVIGKLKALDGLERLQNLNNSIEQDRSEHRNNLDTSFSILRVTQTIADINKKLLALPETTSRIFAIPGIIELEKAEFEKNKSYSTKLGGIISGIIALRTKMRKSADIDKMQGKAEEIKALRGEIARLPRTEQVKALIYAIEGQNKLHNASPLLMQITALQANIGGIRDDLQKTRIACDNLNKYMALAKNLTKSIKDLDFWIKDAEKELQNLKPVLCPTCGRAITQDPEA